MKTYTVGSLSFIAKPQNARKHTIPKTVRAAVNRSAHASAAREFERIRILLLAEVETAKADGATDAEVLDMLTRVRDAPARASETYGAITK